MIKIVREPSDTPNIQNTDDFVGLRYSYGDYNGYVNNKGQMLAYQINGSTFKVLSGRAVVNGVEVDIDANGASITIDNISQTQAHSLYIRVNLATMKADLFDVIGDNLPTSDDLTANTIGMAYLLLYTFSSTAGVISDVVKKVERVVGLREVVSGITPVAEAKHADNATIADKAEKTDFTNGEWHTGAFVLTDEDRSNSSKNMYEFFVAVYLPDAYSSAHSTKVGYFHNMMTFRGVSEVGDTYEFSIGSMIYECKNTNTYKRIDVVLELDSSYRVSCKRIMTKLGSSDTPETAPYTNLLNWRRIR